MPAKRKPPSPHAKAERHLAKCHDGLRDMIRRVGPCTLQPNGNYFYLLVRTIISQEHAAAFEDYDLLVSPTSPTVAFKIGEKAENPLAMYLSDLLTIPSNMAGLPGLSIPCGLSEGLPVGFQLIGPQFSENLLFRAGHALERALGFDVAPERLR